MQQRVPEPGEVIDDRYVVDRELARGGMGAVFIARHRTTEATVALKVLLDAGVEPKLRERFVREARVASALKHPGIVRIFDAGDDARYGPYIAMELLSGETLERHVERVNPSRADRIALVREMLEGLAVAHEAGVVHRDIKPENMFLADDGEGGVRVKLLDFGIARVQAASNQTVDGMALGTIYYMAPEQMRDARRASPAADVWSVGVMLYQLLSDVLPFDGPTIHVVAVQVCTANPIPLEQHVPDLDPALASLVMRCLDREVSNRPQDARALADALDELGVLRVRSPGASLLMRVSPDDEGRRSHVPRLSLEPRGASSPDLSVGRAFTVETQLPISTERASMVDDHSSPGIDRRSAVPTPPRESRTPHAMEASPATAEKRSTGRTTLGVIAAGALLAALGGVLAQRLRPRNEVSGTVGAGGIVTTTQTASRPSSPNAPLPAPTPTPAQPPAPLPSAPAPSERALEARPAVRSGSQRSAGLLARSNGGSTATSTGPSTGIADAPPTPPPVENPTAQVTSAPAVIPTVPVPPTPPANSTPPANPTVAQPPPQNPATVTNAARPAPTPPARPAPSRPAHVESEPEAPLTF